MSGHLERQHSGQEHLLQSRGPEFRTWHSCDLSSNVGRAGGRLETGGFQTAKIGVPKFRKRQSEIKEGARNSLLLPVYAQSYLLHTSEYIFY